MGAFKVLMWKHYTVRKRRIIQTVIEFIAPVALILGLFILKDSMQDKTDPNKHSLRSGLATRFTLDSVAVPFRILYTPDSKASRKLMDEVGSNLGVRHLNSMPNVYTKGYYAFSNADLLKDFYKTMSYNDVVLFFEDMSSSTLPDKLNYTMQMNIPVPRTLDIPNYKPSEQLGIKKFELTYCSSLKLENLREPFLRLQWAIDSSYLKLKSNGGLKLKNVTFEELSNLRTQPLRNIIYIKTASFLLTYLSFVGPLLPFIFLMIRLLEERSTGIQELVKMVGVTPAMLGITQFLNSLPACVLFSVGGTILLKITEKPMIPETHPMILFLGLTLHFITIISMAFAFSYIARNAQYTVSLSMFVYIGLWIPIRLIKFKGYSNFGLFLRGLLPHCPTYWFYNEIEIAEVRGVGLDFHNWTDLYAKYDDGATNACVMVSYIMQLLQIAIFFSLSAYLERVRPGKYGIALPWNFLCQKDYWRKQQSIPEMSGEALASHDPVYQKFFEEQPTNMFAGIKISHVSKIFGTGKKKFQALNNVTFDIYKGEITVLLGHNGAGKTTLISIITGMINPTSGKIYVNGMDTVSQQAEVRKHLGLCPQHNLFFPDLTVMEHFLFFSMIKGGSFEEAKKSSYALLEQLDLADKANRKTSELSGGMLRRLQLGCALCGNASVLILDEPTSGLDVEARRELWDMLLALRGDRTLVLTTHFMEEADVLGDRMAALHAGRLRCHATPMYLKRAVGSGFRLSITTFGEPDADRILQCIKEMAPGASLKEKSMNFLLYDLPTGTNLPALFNSVEKRKAELNIESLGVGITTLEEVFLELCCDVEAPTELSADTEQIPVQYKYVTGFRHTCRQMAELFRRQFNYTMSKRIAFFILQIAMPFIMCILLTQLFSNEEVGGGGGHELLNIEKFTSDVKSPTVIYRIQNYSNTNAVQTIKRAYPKFEVESIDEVKDSIRFNTDERGDAETRVLGIEVNDSHAKVLYVPELRNTAPVGLNLLSNILADQEMYPNGTTIVTNVANKWQLRSPYFEPKNKMNCALFAIFNIFILIATAINDVILPCRERLTVARHTHIMAGCPPFLYWLTTFIYHYFCYLIFSITAAIISITYFDPDDTLTDSTTRLAYFTVLLLSGMDFYAFAYWVSYYFNERTCSMLLIGLTIVFGFFSPILIMALDDLNKTDDEPVFTQIMDIVGLVIPAHVITQAVTRMTDSARFNAYCTKNFDKCPDLAYYTKGFDKEKCCEEGTADEGPFDHYSYTKYGMGASLVVLIVQFIVFSILVLLLEYGVFNRWWNNIGKMRKIDAPPKQFNCPEVAAEKEYVNRTICLPREQVEDTMLVNNVSKTYFKVCGRPTFALRDENFSVKKGECFGILGVNGAGKTTTFKVISNEEAATHGTVYVGGHFVGSDRTKYLRTLGYCPQFCGLDDFRTGGDNLRMLLTLRGFSDEDVKREMRAWLDVVGMTKYANRVVSGYSGGMVRRLATAASLCGGSPVTLLDEPTAGVDTAARRLVWEALKRGLLHDRAIVLTSHSMDEMEMLCKRVTILSSGEMCVLGTPLALRETYAAGHAVVFKLRADFVHSDIGKDKLQRLKNSIEQKFNCTLKDEHLTSLHYRINEKLLYSDIFTRMETLEKEFSDLIEDYSVSDTTLEDVFLTFANEETAARNGPKSANAKV